MVNFISCEASLLCSITNRIYMYIYNITVQHNLIMQTQCMMIIPNILYNNSSHNLIMQTQCMIIIPNILYYNSSPVQAWITSYSKQNQFKNSPTVPPKYKLATFTYTGKETTHITKIFKHANIKISYRTNNTIQDNF
jgi:hypothetical protein